MRFSRTNMRLAAARCRSLSRKIGVQTAEFSITAFCWRNADSRKSRTYERHNAEIRLELFNLSQERAPDGAQLPGRASRRCCQRRARGGGLQLPPSPEMARSLAPLRPGCPHTIKLREPD